MPIILLLMALLALPRLAEALSCMPPPEIIAPSVDEVDAPPDARVWLSGWQFGEDDVFRIIDEATGEEAGHAASSIRITNRSFLHVLTPDELLKPGTTYRIEWEGGGDPITRFAVGEEGETTLPSVPKVRSAKGETIRHSFFDPWVAHRVRFELEHDSFLVVVDRDGQATLDPLAFSGSVTAVTTGTFATLGSGGCDSGWTDAAPGARTNARFGAFDLAGNFSGWSEPTTAAVPLLDFGCSSAAGNALGLVPLVALWLRRRSKRS